MAISENYHQPVMLQECLEGLAIQPSGIYVDVTFGGGGHSQAIVEKLSPSGKLFGFDQDADAAVQAKKLASYPQFHFVAANFRFIKNYLKLNAVAQVDGILADLGVSSHQINTPSRGFSTRFEGVLDMRMDAGSQNMTAADVLNTYEESQLHKIFGLYGEVKNAKTLAQQVVKARIANKIETTQDLKNIALALAPKKMEHKYLAQVFQALRIEVNDELEALQAFLLQTTEVIRPGGRLVVMSYHSLEDRLVKNFIQKGKFFGEIEKDLYGHYSLPFEALHRKPIVATDEEIEANNRARSAKLRIAIKQ